MDDTYYIDDCLNQGYIYVDINKRPEVVGVCKNINAFCPTCKDIYITKFYNFIYSSGLIKKIYT